MTPEQKAVNLHAALRSLLDSYKDMVFTCNQEPLFGEHPTIVKAEQALFENRPDAAWEQR